MGGLWQNHTLLITVHNSNGALLCLFCVSGGVNMCSCLAIGDSLRPNSLVCLFNCRCLSVGHFPQCNWKGKVSIVWRGLLNISCFLSRRCQRGTDRKVQSKLNDLVCVDFSHAFMAVRFPLVFSAAVSHRGSDSPRVQPHPLLLTSTFRALPGLKPELVCFLLSVCWSRRGGVRAWNLFGRLRQATLTPPLTLNTHRHPPAE